MIVHVDEQAPLIDNSGLMTVSPRRKRKVPFVPVSFHRSLYRKGRTFVLDGRFFGFLPLFSLTPIR